MSYQLKSSKLESMKLITITTDFGNLNGFTGTMKGVIYGITPDAQIVDITHEIPAQDVRTGAIACSVCTIDKCSAKSNHMM